MTWVLTTCHTAEDDEPHLVYSELDEARRERRRVEFYQNGLCFSYGGDRGHEEALNPDPFPEELQALNRPGEVEAVTVPRSLFVEIWNQAQERPDGFMGLLF